jgi:hypothetical protein
MDDAAKSEGAGEDFFTLLGVRGDGVASVVDLVAVDESAHIRLRVNQLLRQHASCDVVEVWRDGALLEQHPRS